MFDLSSDHKIVNDWGATTSAGLSMLEGGYT